MTVVHQPPLTADQAARADAVIFALAKLWPRCFAIARIYRPGQTRNTTIHVCIAAGTVDEMKRDRVIGKMTAQEAFRRHLEQIR